MTHEAVLSQPIELGQCLAAEMQRHPAGAHGHIARAQAELDVLGDALVRVMLDFEPWNAAVKVVCAVDPRIASEGERLSARLREET